MVFEARVFVTTRRGMLAATLCGTVSGTIPVRAPPTPKTSVLVHGAWGGGWPFSNAIDCGYLFCPNLAINSLLIL